MSQISWKCVFYYYLYMFIISIKYFGTCQPHRGFFNHVYTFTEATFYECIRELLSSVFKNVFSKKCLHRLIRSDRQLITYTWWMLLGLWELFWYVLKELFAKKAPDGSKNTLIDSINAWESFSEMFQCGFSSLMVYAGYKTGYLHLWMLIRIWFRTNQIYLKHFSLQISSLLI